MQILVIMGQFFEIGANMTYRLSTNDSLSQIFSKAAETVGSADEKIYIILSDGEHHGLEHERIFYDLPNPLVIEGESGDSSKS